MRRLFRRRTEPLPPPGATPDEAATQPLTVETEEAITAPPRRPPRLWPWLLALLLLVLAGLAAAFLLTRDDDDEGGQDTTVTTVRVPNVVGRPAGEATRTVLADGLRVQVARVESERASGTVLRQRPAAGATLDRGGVVTLVVSRGEPMVGVPDVVGLPLAQAFRRVEAAGLRPRARRVFASQPRGRVIRQRPAADAQVAREEVVLLTVSRGRQQVAVPDVVGLTGTEAERRLESAGLEANLVRVPASQPAGTVVAQRPPAGGRIARGSRVRVNVSRGTGATTTTTTTTTTATAPPPPPPPTVPTTTGTGSAVVTVPDVTGLDLAAAERRLRQAGFDSRSVGRETVDPAEDGIVLEQRPAGGASARAGAQVTLTVGVLTP